MKNTLHLTADEEKIFSTLSEELCDGWIVEPESLTYTDDVMHLRIRMQMITLQDPSMQTFLEKAKTMGDADQLAALIMETDLQHASSTELTDLFFAMGPEPLSKIIPTMLQQVQTDEDVMDIAAITEIRHTLLLSMQLPS